MWCVCYMCCMFYHCIITDLESANKHSHLLKIINVPRHGKRDLKSEK